MRYQCDWTYAHAPRCLTTIEVPDDPPPYPISRDYWFHLNSVYFRDWTIGRGILEGKAYCRIHRDDLLLRENRGEILRPALLPNHAHAVTSHATYVSGTQYEEGASMVPRPPRPLPKPRSVASFFQPGVTPTLPTLPRYGQGMVRPFLSSDTLAQRVIDAATITDRVE